MKYVLENDRLTCIFDERIDTEAARRIDEELSEHVKAGPKSVVFDMTHVQYIASAFLRICLKTAKDIGKESFSIVNVQPTVKRIFKIAQLDSLIQIT